MMSRLLSGCAIGALALGVAAPALAQSTASQMQDIVVTATATQQTVGGLIKAEQAPKTRSTITDEFIGTQAAGQTVAQLINLLPGVNFTNSDPYGNSGGNLRIRGFDGARVSMTFDGVPLNDTGNYALYTNQQLDSELMERVNVNLGTTDVDSPTASATGGTINYVSRTPAKDFGVMLQPSIGSFNYRRLFGMVDTGEFTAIGTKAWFAASYTNYDKFKGPGELEKQQYNGRIYQPIGDNGDFISIAGHWNVNRNNFYNNINLANWRLDKSGEDFEYLDGDYVIDAPTAGVADNDGSSMSSYYKLRINPSNTGNIRVQSRFTLADGVILTVDPSFQYVLANGGGSQLFAETDPRLRGTSSATGVDLNGDGDVLDRVRLYAPNTTNTRRYGLTSSLIWDINDNNKVRVAYTFDRGRHRQTGRVGYISADGAPENVFAGLKGDPIETADGNVLRTRDRLSIAQLHQVSGEYTLKAFDNALRVNLGVRAPFFKRELNQYCYTINSMSVSGAFSGTYTLNSNQYCTSGTVANATGVTFGSTVVAPYEATRKYDKVLPNLGVSYRLDGGHQLYASYAEGLSAPRTDFLYGIQIANPQPETTQAYDLGYRFQGDTVTASLAGWYTKYKNRIVTSYNDETGLFEDRNVGAVDLWGADFEIGVQPVKSLTVYASASWSKSEIQANYLTFTSSQIVEVPTKGKRLVETPEWTFSARAEYEYEGFTLGGQVKHVGARWATDLNDQKSPAYTVVDLDVRYDLGDLLNLKGSYLQVNVTNLFDADYLGNISSTRNAVATTVDSVNGTPVTLSATQPTYAIGAPRTVQATLRLAF